MGNKIRAGKCCDCKTVWLPPSEEKNGVFPDVVCKKCKRSFTGKELLDLCGARMEINEYDPNKLYDKMVHYYMDKKGYSKDQANTIAMKVVAEQNAKHLSENPQVNNLSKYL